MDVDHPEDDQRWDSRERGETELQRLERNRNSLLQELRVVQTGVQLLTGFLLTPPFQQRFSILPVDMRIVYLFGGCNGAADRPAQLWPPRSLRLPADQALMTL